MKEVMITGASKGIGKALAKEFLNYGYNIILVARNVEELNKTKNELQKEYSKSSIKTEAMDLILKENLHELVTKYPDIDILVNNAAMVKLGHSFHIENEEQMRGIKLNVETPCFLSNFYIKKMLEKNDNKNFLGIINVSSVAGLFAHPLTNYYSPSKYFLDQYSCNLWYELKRKFKTKNINVMSLCPGAVRTDFTGENKFLKMKKSCDKFKFLNLYLEPDYVAKAAVKDFFKNKKRSVPGKFYKLSKLIIKFLPERLIAKVVYDGIEREIE